MMTLRGFLGLLAACLLSWALVVILWLMLWTTVATFTARKAHAQSWPDAGRIAAMADSAGIDRRAALAIAWEETGDNIDPKVRGHHCWWTKAEVRDERLELTDTVALKDVSKFVANGYTVVGKIVHHEKNCEVGRMQIKPSTARLRCPGLDIFTYDGNLTCFTRMFKEDADTNGTLFAIVHHNGRGPKAQEYLNRVLKTVGRIALTEET